MNKKTNCSVCNIKLDKDIYKKDRTVCKSCYNGKKRNKNNNTSHNNQKSKVLITITMIIELQTSAKILEVPEVLEVL